MARAILLSIFLPACSFFHLKAQTPFWSLSPGTGGFFLSDLAYAPSNPDSLVLSAWGPLLLSTDGGDSWSDVAQGSCCGVLAFDSADPTILFLNETGLPFDGNAIWKSTDTGVSWQFLLDGQCLEQKVCAAPVLAYGPAGAPGLYASVNPIHLKKTTDRGVTWEAVSIPDRNGLWSIAPSPESSSVMYIAYTDTVTVFRTDDGGTTWSERPFPFLVETAVDLAVDPSEENTIYAALDGYGVFKSTDGGLTWEQRNTGLTADQLDIKSIAVNPHAPSEIFIGLGDDQPFDGRADLIAVSVDGAGSWTPLNDGLPHAGHVPRILIDPRFFRLFAVVISPQDSFALSGVYRAGILTGADKKELLLPEHVELLQNYPNPFNGISYFGFRISNFGSVSLTIYDVLGREVATVVEESLLPGSYRVRWDAGNLPSGFYFYSLTTGTTRITRSLTLIR